MRRVLLISNIFPPSAGSPSEKAGARVKYLHQNGWESVVLAPALDPTEPRDEDIVREMPPYEIHRTPYLFHKQMPSLNKSRGIFLTKQDGGAGSFYLPNGYIRWLPYAVRLGARLAKNVDLILSFNNPTMMHVIGYLVSRLSGKPWVAALRDPVSGNPIHRRGPELFNAWVEKLVAARAQRVVQWGDYVVEPMALRHPGQPAERFVIIPYTGYNPDDFRGLDLAPPPKQLPLRIAYTGTFYAGSITPEPILQALGKIVAQGSLSPGDIQLTFAGDWDAAYDRLVEAQNLGNCVRYLGKISRQACVKLWAESHVLLVILGDNFDSPDRFPAKFWDYTGAQRFMLGLVPPQGKLARLIIEQNLGLVAPPNDVPQIAQTLQHLVERLPQGDLLPRPAPEFLQQASRVHGEQALARVLDDVFRENGRKV